MEINDSILRQEALLRSILSHQVAFANSIPLLFGANEELYKAYLETYNKHVKQATEFYLSDAASIQARDK